MTISKIKWPPTRGSKGHFESPGGGFNSTEKYNRPNGKLPHVVGENKKYLSCHHLEKQLILIDGPYGNVDLEYFTPTWIFVVPKI